MLTSLLFACFDHLHIGCIALCCIQNFYLLVNLLQGGCLAFQDQDTLVGRQEGGGAVAWVELEGSPLVKGLVVKIYPLFNPALVLVHPA